MRRCLLLGLLIGPLVLGTACAGETVDVNDEQRERFLAAYERLENRQPVDVGLQQRALAGYPLAPYLTYRDLLNRISRADPAEVRAFLDQHDDLPVTGLLTGRWLNSLGRRADWETFLEFDDGRGGSQATCYRLRARRHVDGVDDAWLDEARELWTVGHSQPEACDPVFAELYERGALGAERRWRRIELIMGAGNPRLARAIRHRLGEEEQRWLSHWLRLSERPAAVLRDPGFDTTVGRGRTLALDGFQRLARADRDAALRLLARYEDEQRLATEDIHGVRREIALRAAYSREPRALALLESLPTGVVDEQVREWRARVSVGQQNWPAVVRAVEAMPAAEQGQSEWRYWLAHALREAGEMVRAEALLTELAGERHYYGFLAADTLGRPYTMNHEPAPLDRARKAELGSRPGIVRAREWLRLGYTTEARREWHAALADAGNDDWGQAAQLAMSWGWYDRVVHAANRAGLHNALELRFPLAYRDSVESDARAAGVDPALVFALIRKESAFNPEARSPVGALGLMQVMPGTGREVARRHGMGSPSPGQLLSPDTNLRLGNLFLAEMLERFEGNMILAGAAYNAGPNRTDGWKADNAGQPAAVWIENITYGETRDYVKSLLAFRAVFDWQLRGEPRSLAAVMHTMPGVPAGLDVALHDD